MKIVMAEIEARIDKGEKLSRAESSVVMRHLNKTHFNRMDYPIKIESWLLNLLEAQARTRAKIRLNTDYSKIN